jgi:RimJ/RimL family protein N-acetyltransferase
VIVGGRDLEVAEWVADRCPHLELEVHDGKPQFTAIGWERRGELVAGVVYDGYTRINIDMHVAAEGVRWLTREFLGEAFRYPFVQLSVRRVTGKVPATNAAARRFDEHLGFTYEGTIRQALPGGEDLIVYGMLKSECRWLEVGNGQRLRAVGT